MVEGGLAIRAIQYVGVILILVGVLFFTNVLAFVTVVVDTTPPIIVSTNPADGSTIPKLNSISAQLRDLESGILTIGAYLYNPSGGLIMIYAPLLSNGTIYDGTWSISFSELATPGNNYKIYFIVKNKAGLTTSQNVYFNIYTALQGTWYVNDVEITSSTQTVYATNTSVNFKFVKSAGVDDSKIKCWVEEGGTKILDLTLSAAGTWTGSKTLSAGTHSLALKAYDGTSTITMSIINMQIGEEWTLPSLPPIGVNQLLGAALIVVGAVLLAFRKKTV
jgi:hypothetical protein